jgi:GTP cyclohydrolase FolE2
MNLILFITIKKQLQGTVSLKGSLAVDLGVHLSRSHDLVQHLLEEGEDDMSESDLQTSGDAEEEELVPTIGFVGEVLR